ncbi:MAG: serine/threonine-protein phosphatase [Actinomycetota bacterium]|nr:serine/threonine-protein phosphatase [Actinomycetota bacterium]
MRIKLALRRARSVLVGEQGTFGVLCLLAVALAVVQVVMPQWAPVALQVGPLVAGGLLLPLRYVLALLGVVAVGVLAAATLGNMSGADVPSVVAVMVAALGALQIAYRRRRLGLPATRSEAMLVELRDRLQAQGEIPDLPRGWNVEFAMRSAGGAAFAGDFVTSSLINHHGAPRLELSLVDVSGKGVSAGTRALLLSGALGGLIGAVQPERFLVEANRYLLRQEWLEGFATAVHVTLDLATGGYALESAGHPPAVQFEAGSGRWRVSPVSGPLLGVMEDVAYSRGRGVLGPGDALLLYTDGVVEVPGRDIDVGLDRLLGAAERLVPRGGFALGAERLVDEVARDAFDDRALVLIWRS